MRTRAPSRKASREFSQGGGCGRALLFVRHARRVERRNREFEAWVMRMFPGIAPAEARRVARFACARRTDRVGALSDAEAYVEHAVELAVIAHARHRFTEYEALIERGYDRETAREIVRPSVLARLRAWSTAPQPHREPDE